MTANQLCQSKLRILCLNLLFHSPLDQCVVMSLNREKECLEISVNYSLDTQLSILLLKASWQDIPVWPLIVWDSLTLCASRALGWNRLQVWLHWLICVYRARSLRVKNLCLPWWKEMYLDVLVLLMTHIQFIGPEEESEKRENYFANIPPTSLTPDQDMDAYVFMIKEGLVLLWQSLFC